MDQVVERPGALDVHKAKVTACVRTPGERGQRKQEVVRGLLALRDWLASLGRSASKRKRGAERPFA